MAARNVRVGDSVITKSQIPGLITSMIWAGEARQWRCGLSWTGRPDVRHHRPRHGFTRTSSSGLPQPALPGLPEPSSRKGCLIVLIRNATSKVARYLVPKFCEIPLSK